MSAVIAQAQKPAVLAPAHQVGVAKALAQIQGNVLAPVEVSSWSPDSWRDFLQLTRDLPDDPARVSHSAWRNAKQAVLLAPEDADLAALGAALELALSGPPDAAKTRAMVGMLLDAFPNGRPANLPAYADSILHDLTILGFSPTVVALGCQSVRRTAKFLPTVAEVIEACEEAVKRLKDRRAGNNYALKMLSVAKAIAALPEPEMTPWERRLAERDREVVDPEVLAKLVAEVASSSKEGGGRRSPDAE